MFEWAMRREQGHAHAGLTVSKNAAVSGSVQRLPLVRQLLTSLQNVSRSIHLLFGAVDNRFRDAYATAFATIPAEYRHYFSTNMPAVENKQSIPCDADIFSYRALLINLWTQPHRDMLD